MTAGPHRGQKLEPQFSDDPADRVILKSSLLQQGPDLGLRAHVLPTRERQSRGKRQQECWVIESVSLALESAFNSVPSMFNLTRSTRSTPSSETMSSMVLSFTGITPVPPAIVFDCCRSLSKSVIVAIPA